MNFCSCVKGVQMYNTSQRRTRDLFSTKDMTTLETVHVRFIT